jgi:hypothetical protein
MDSFRCKVCGNRIEGTFVQIGALVFFQIGQVLQRRGMCANCQCELYFDPADGPLPEFMQKRAERMAAVDKMLSDERERLAAARTATT